MIIFFNKKAVQPRKKLRLPVIITAIVLFFAGVLGGYTVFTLWSATASLKSHLTSLEAAVRDARFEDARGDLRAIGANARTIHAATYPLQIFSFVPYVGPHISAVVYGTESAQQLARAGDELLVVGGDVVSVLRTTDGTTEIGHLSEQQKSQILEAVDKNAYRLNGIKGEVTLARQGLDKINERVLHPRIGGPLATVKSAVTTLEETLDRAVPLVDVALATLGYPKDKTYLFLLQNNAEVRATGGFIGNYGILKIKSGEITSFKTDNIYNIDDPAKAYLSVRPPTAFGRYFKTDRWFLRDSNWSPDFEESAEKAEWFYQQEGGREKLDGVIAITQDVIVSLLRVTGPITVENITFTADNFYEELQYQVEKGYYKQGIPESQRKEVVGELAKKIIENVYSMPRERLVDLFGVFERNVSEKHIMMYFNDPVVQLSARELNWAGQVRDTEGDFLMVVDSNMGALKTDLVMDKKINYSVREDYDGSLYGKVELNYTNNGSFTWFTTRYRDWVRILVPVGSVLVRTEGAMVKELSDEVGSVETTSEAGKTAFGAYIVVEPKTTKRFMVEYKLPREIAASVRSGRYTLLAQKQSGVSNQRLEISAQFRRWVKDYSPRGVFNEKASVNSVRFSSDLRVDRQFEVVF